MTSRPLLASRDNIWARVIERCPTGLAIVDIRDPAHEHGCQTMTFEAVVLCCCGAPTRARVWATRLVVVRTPPSRELVGQLRRSVDGGGDASAASGRRIDLESATDGGQPVRHVR